MRQCVSQGNVVAILCTQGRERVLISGTRGTYLGNSRSFLHTSTSMQHSQTAANMNRQDVYSAPNNYGIAHIWFTIAI